MSDLVDPVPDPVADAECNASKQSLIASLQGTLRQQQALLAAAKDDTPKRAADKQATQVRVERIQARLDQVRR